MNQKIMRMGPVTLLTFLILLVLAVMAVLEVSTVNAQNAITERQKATVAATYKNEATAQAFLAGLDQAIQQEGDDGGLASLRQQVSSAKAAQEIADGQMAAIGQTPSRVTNLEWQNQTLTVTFEADDFRRLTVTVAPEAQQGYVVTQWSASTVWQEEEGVGLWNGQ